MSFHPPAGRTSQAGRRAFSLIEILVAVTVLVLLLALVAEMTARTSSTIEASNRHMDAASQERLLFDRIGFDLARMLRRSDIDYSFSKHSGDSGGGANDELSFYCETAGLYSFTSSTYRRLSVVGYRVYSGDAKTTTLQRAALGMEWDGMVFTEMDSTGVQTPKFDKPNTLPALSTELYQILADQVFRFELSYLTRPTTTQVQPRQVAAFPGKLEQVAAVIVTVAVLDNRSRQLVKDMPSLVKLFPDSADDHSPLSEWTELVNSADFSKKANIPPQVAQSVRVYQRYFYLP
jgi:prepilin-type N-terminal cleavage/methylation domain-containing protein